MTLKLEDLTKDELLRLFRRLLSREPSQQDMLLERWESLVAKSQRLGAEGNNASQARDWARAEKLWAEEERAWAKAEAVFAEAEAQCPKP